jgi:hypothetical protein
MQKRQAAVDTFAAIATELVSDRHAGLEPPTLVQKPSDPLPLQAGKAENPHPRSQKISSPEQLRAELDLLRQRMSPFLAYFAPELPISRSVLAVRKFQWRIETPQDRSNFAAVQTGSGDWQDVSIPHYGPPLGPAATIYRQQTDLPDEIFSRERQVLCFDAVDYRCQVYLNGVCLGTHEGFFEAFEFDVTGIARRIGNVLLVRVENDFTMLGQAFSDGDTDGDKIYAATGLGYDDPEEGWHHCPPGMGIWQGVRFESRSRLAITDLFLRPLPSLDAVEIQVEIQNSGSNPPEKAALCVSIYGRNFECLVHENHIHSGTGQWVRGFGDLDHGTPESEPALMGPGKNYLLLTLPIPNAKIWDLETPWLYQAHVSLQDADGHLLDAAGCQFGMRRFEQDENSTPKGKFRLNGREIRLRGANTMGNLDLCVFRGDTEQLHDDILLAKLTNLNFLRLTQHPVQREVYEACDRLGLMLQTDLPLFGSIRKNQFHECVRQAAAMERLVRSHPSSVLVSFINEPFPAARAKPHRFMIRGDMELFFDVASKAVRRENPGRVIKCVDGDYDPPVPEGMQDNHCYCGWYIGHGIDLGHLHHGGWMPVKPGWHFGCGEFGSEGLDSREVMESYYPSTWLQTTNDGAWTPAVIPKAQSMNFHYLWYPSPSSLDDWIEASQRHQDWITRLMTEAFRRLPGMNTFAIHLFIDAWPAGWMKTIMDVNRIPKKAWFTFRDVLSPVAVSLRTDRYSGFAGDSLPVELCVLNDLDHTLDGWTLFYEITQEGEIVASGNAPAKIASSAPSAQGAISVPLPEVKSRTLLKVSASLVNSAGTAIHDSEITLEVFPKCSPSTSKVFVFGAETLGASILEGLGMEIFKGPMEEAEVILIADSIDYFSSPQKVDAAVRRGAMAVLLSLPIGSHSIGSHSLKVRMAGMGPRHFVSCDSGHPLVAGFQCEDFKFWFDENLGYASPILSTVLEADGWPPILESGDGGWGRPWGPVPVSVEKSDGEGCWRICQVELHNRLRSNPAATIFTQRLLSVSR